MEYFPIFVDIHDRKVLVIGHYRVLEFKIKKLLEAEAKIVYLTNSLSSNGVFFQSLTTSGFILIRLRFMNLTFSVLLSNVPLRLSIKVTKG